MPSMDYCKFENTASDIADCLEALREGVKFNKLSSQYERIGFKAFLAHCLEIAEIVKDGRDEAIFENNEELVTRFIEDECLDAGEEMEEE